MGQAIRPSQFILSYGVGSIIEAPRGPRLVPVFDKWDLSRTIFASGAIARFRVEDPNASAQLNGGEIFEIPTNAQFDLSESRPLFRTIRFPHWALCQRHRILYRLGAQGRSKCPRCGGRAGDAQDESIRFVRACPNGHLDDVDWHGTVHAGRACGGDSFDWVEETGSDLKSVRVRCRTCSAEMSLLDIYYRTYSCSGYFPEEAAAEPCEEQASVVLRSATSLRIAEVVTSITIPPPALRIHTLLSQPAIGMGLLGLAASSKDPKGDLLNYLRKIAANMPDQIDPATIAEIERTPPDEVEQAIRDLLAPRGGSKTIEDVKEEEFTALQEAAEHGYPPRPSTGPLFEVDRDAVIRLTHPSEVTFRVAPVKRLRVALVQRGYRRPVRGHLYKCSHPHNGQPIALVETFHMLDGKRWYPGVKLQGEGIFIDLLNENPRLNEQRVKIWLDREREVQGSLDAYLYHPIFVWWHTLAHRLINALSIDSGYSSAAIRERVYFREGSKMREPSGGILLYTSQQGSDGSLGGLIALCGRSEFASVMAAAERNINACSNDPLCSEHLERNNGAACYACLLISETSCEFHNTYLDRLLLARSLVRRVR